MRKVNSFFIYSIFLTMASWPLSSNAAGVAPCDTANLINVEIHPSWGGYFPYAKCIYANGTHSIKNCIDMRALFGGWKQGPHGTYHCSELHGNTCKPTTVTVGVMPKNECDPATGYKPNNQRGHGVISTQ